MPYHPTLRTENGKYRMLESGSRVVCKDVYNGNVLTGRISDQRMFHGNILYGVVVEGKLYHTNAHLILNILH